MKTKRFLLICLVMVIGFTLSACAAVQPHQESMAVQVPEAINLAIGTGVAALLALGAAYVFQKLGLDLRGYTAPVAITLSAWIVAELQNVVNIIPEMYDPYIDFAFRVIVLLLAPTGLLAWRKYSVGRGKSELGALMEPGDRLL